MPSRGLFRFSFPMEDAEISDWSRRKGPAGVRYTATVSAESPLDLGAIEFVVDLPRVVFLNGTATPAGTRATRIVGIEGDGVRRRRRGGAGEGQQRCDHAGRGLVRNGAGLPCRSMGCLRAFVADSAAHQERRDGSWSQGDAGDHAVSRIGLAISPL